ncbi:capsule biosynthesis protein [Novosphingobium sp. AAP83]|uniref:capsule biosynthesis protein n=1 Tax=Novosphingobium sp. AAP83 TaxID=1523425 RepID=UPI0006B88365|nr:capsule biosynthesis protein [Novosphingobium sp. AAP83]KPF91678.1 capsule biosynthesis protein [Novosphingobium sp. AAP83]
MNVEQSFPFEAEVTAKRSTFADWFVKRRWFMLGVVVPTLIAVLYYGFIASDVYISESRFVIKSPDQKRSQTSTLANLIQTTGLSAGQEQTNEVLGFVRSRDALKSLEKDVGIRDQFANSGADFLSRFPGPLSQNTFEDLFRYYGNMVDARLDSDTGLAVIKVKAFSAQDAYAINAKLLNLSEGLVNRLNSRAQNNGIAEAQKQVDLATIKAKETRVALAQYRNAQSLIDPERQAVGVLEISSGLVAQRAALQAQLEQMQRVTPGNPSLPALQNRIASISNQIALQDGRVVGSNSGIASKLGGYENLVVEQEFATQRLNAANTALAQASAEAVRQQFYLERVVDPNVPDMPLLPRRFFNILIVAAVALCLYFIAWMFVVGILEHASDD